MDELRRGSGGTARLPQPALPVPLRPRRGSPGSPSLRALPPCPEKQEAGGRESVRGCCGCPGEHRLRAAPARPRAREGTAVPAAARRDSGSSVVSKGELRPTASPSTAFCRHRLWLYTLLCLLNKMSVPSSRAFGRACERKGRMKAFVSPGSGHRRQQRMEPNAPDPAPATAGKRCQGGLSCLRATPDGQSCRC